MIGWRPVLLRLAVAALLLGFVGRHALAAPPHTGPVAATPETPDQVVVTAMRQAIGGPLRADIGDQAVVRLADGLLLVPRQPAEQLLAVMKTPVPAGFQAMLIGPKGMDTPGLVRFVPAGFIDSNAALTWTPDDLLSSLNDTVARDNPRRRKDNIPEREARRWVLPPHYNPESHQLTWAALILPKSAPREADGEVTFHALAFGRQGYIELTVETSLEQADETGQMVDDFMAGLRFRPGYAYGDALPTDKRAPGGLAAAMGLDVLHRASSDERFWGSDAMLPAAGGIVGCIGLLSLILYIRRHRRLDSRRG